MFEPVIEPLLLGLIIEDYLLIPPYLAIPESLIFNLFIIGEGDYWLDLFIFPSMLRPNVYKCRKLLDLDLVISSSSSPSVWPNSSFTSSSSSESLDEFEGSFFYSKAEISVFLSSSPFS